jgi:hypothetical protein
MLRKALLVCGVLSSVLCVFMNIFVAIQWEGYSSISQTISELSAIGAPTRPLWVVLGIAYTVVLTSPRRGVRRRGFFPTRAKFSAHRASGYA